MCLSNEMRGSMMCDKHKVVSVDTIHNTLLG